MEPLDGPFRKFREEFIGNKQRLGLRVLDDHVELLARKSGRIGTAIMPADVTAK